MNCTYSVGDCAVLFPRHASIPLMAANMGRLNTWPQSNQACIYRQDRISVYSMGCCCLLHIQWQLVPPRRVREPCPLYSIVCIPETTLKV